MRKVIATIAGIALLGFAGAASADEAAGKIESVDPATRTIMLDDGNTYTVSDGVAIEGLEPGTEVTVSFEEQDGQKTATEVTPK